MPSSHAPGICGITRRGFLAGAAAGLAAGVPLTWLGLDALRRPAPGTPAAPPPLPAAETKFAMPGPYPGRVIEVRHPDSVRPDHTVNADAVSAMIDRGMTELTGADHPVEAWRSFFDKDDVVGIKVNPVGRKAIAKDQGYRMPQAVGAISSPEVLLKIVKELKAVGVKPQNIILFERYAQEFADAGYADLMHERILSGVRWYASAADYTDTQVDVAGFDRGRDSISWELGRHVVGYDPDVFVHMGFALPEHDPKDDRRFRTHLSLIVSRMVNKIITIPVLKDHRSAGVTLALKNLSHGMNNNVARSHIVGQRHGGREGPAGPTSPNQCNTFIPTAVAQTPTRQKATLHILDGLIGVYEGGPGCWNKTWGTWHHKGLFFATDPVALDHVGWDIIDAKRVEEGWLPVSRAGLYQYTAATPVTCRLAALGAASAQESLVLNVGAKNQQDGRASEVLNMRQPEHVVLAGLLGLGVFDMNRIEHRRVVMS
jgi:hypothetical protein